MISITRRSSPSASARRRSSQPGPRAPLPSQASALPRELSLFSKARIGHAQSLRSAGGNKFSAFAPKPTLSAEQSGACNRAMRFGQQPDATGRIGGIKMWLKLYGKVQRRRYMGCGPAMRHQRRVPRREVHPYQGACGLQGMIVRGQRLQEP